MENSVSQELIEKVRKCATRITSNSLDEEIIMLISSCRKDLILTGIKKEKVNSDDDPMILNAIYNYVRAEFGLDNDDYQKYRDSYISIRNKMALSQEYTIKETNDELGR